MNRNRDDSAQDEPVKERYLWDGSGEPDPELRHLETLLGQFRHQGAPLVLPDETTLQPLKFRPQILQMDRLRHFAAVLTVGLSLAAGVSFILSPMRPAVSRNGWDVECLQGKILLGKDSISTDQTDIKINVGQVLETNGASRASISEKFFGQIDVESNSRVRLEQWDDNHTRIQLDRGTIHAAIWAPPGQFVVDTPSAVAVDLGCAYTLEVSPDGTGSIHTTLGWVGFHRNGRESFIPAGAMCATRPRVGPGRPYFEDATLSFRSAVSDFDATVESQQSDASPLERILAQARAKDAFTLWHLLSRTDGRDRADVYARLAYLIPPPNGVSREGILRLDPSMLDLWWNSLALGDISIWRLWEQSTPPRASISRAGEMNHLPSTSAR